MTTMMGHSELKKFLLIFYILASLIVNFNLASSYPGIDQYGKAIPVGTDFIIHYSASILSMNGEVSAIYNHGKFNSIESTVAGHEIGPFPWHYPPTFLFFVYPLSLLPYIPSFILWMLLTFGLFLLILYRIAPHPFTPAIAFVFPGTFLNFWHGQNGFLFASFLGGGLLLLDSHPLIAGVLLGFLSCKPHLAVIVPVVLLVGRRWLTLCSMVATTIIMIIASIIVFNWSSWEAFFANAPFAKEMLEKGFAPWNKVVTTFVTGKTFGFTNYVAYAMQSAVAILVLWFACYQWLHNSEPAILNSVLIIAILLFSPYVFIYDLTMLAVPIAYMAWLGYSQGLLPGELIILLLVMEMPLYVVGIGLSYHLQIGPFILIAFLFFIIRRSIYLKKSAAGVTLPGPSMVPAKH